MANIIPSLPIYTIPFLYPATMLPVPLESTVQIDVEFFFTSSMLDVNTILFIFDLVISVLPKKLAFEESPFRDSTSLTFKLDIKYNFVFLLEFSSESFNVPVFITIYKSFDVVDIPVKVIVACTSLSDIVCISLTCTVIPEVTLAPFSYTSILVLKLNKDIVQLSSINSVDTLLSKSIPFIIALISVFDIIVGVSFKDHTGGFLSFIGNPDFVSVIPIFLFPYMSPAILGVIVNSTFVPSMIVVPNVFPSSVSSTCNMYCIPFVILFMVILAFSVTFTSFNFIVIKF